MSKTESDQREKKYTRKPVQMLYLSFSPLDVFVLSCVIWRWVQKTYMHDLNE